MPEALRTGDRADRAVAAGRGAATNPRAPARPPRRRLPLHGGRSPPPRIPGRGGGPVTSWVPRSRSSPDERHRSRRPHPTPRRHPRVRARRHPEGARPRRRGQPYRVQVFQGVVIRRQGAGSRETFTVRKVSYGVGVEHTFPHALADRREDRASSPAATSVGRSCTTCTATGRGKKPRNQGEPRLGVTVTSPSRRYSTDNGWECPGER